MKQGRAKTLTLTGLALTGVDFISFTVGFYARTELNTLPSGKFSLHKLTMWPLTFKKQDVYFAFV